jgi:hypothetical protein
MVELVVGHVGRHLSTGNFIFGKESYTVNLSGMFLRPGGSRGGRESVRRWDSEVRPSQLGRCSQLGLLGVRLLGSLGTVFHSKYIYILVASMYYPFFGHQGMGGWT